MQQIKGSVINSMILGRNHFCCLCFKTVADSAIHIEDQVILQKQDNTNETVLMAEILTKILGPEIDDQLSIFNAVCNLCSSEAIKSYKFYLKCQDNSRNLGLIIEGLSKGTEMCQSKSDGAKAGFVTINTENYGYRGYTSIKTSSTGLLAYKQFQKLQWADNLAKKPAMNIVPVNTKRCYSRTTGKTNSARLKLRRLNKTFLNKHHTVFVCPICDKFFARRNSMREHYKKQHLSDVKDIPFDNAQQSLIETKESVHLDGTDDALMEINDGHTLVMKIEIEDEYEDAFRNDFNEERNNVHRKVPLILKRRTLLSKTKDG